MLLAGKFSEIQLDTSAAPRWVMNGVEYELRDIGGFKVWFMVDPFAPRSQGGQPIAPPKSMPDWLEQFAAPFPLDPSASPPPAPPTSSPLGTSPVRDPRGQDLQGLLSWVLLSDPSASPFPPTWVPPANGLGAATSSPGRERQPSGSSLDRTRLEGRPMRYEPYTADEVNRIRFKKLSNFDLPPSENPYDWPEFAIPYRVLYGLKQSFYKPIKSLLLDERPKYLDSNNNVQRVPWQPDRTDALIASAQIASFFLPTPKASSLASDGAAGASALPELVPEVESALAPQLKSALPSTEAPSLFASRPTFGNIGSPQPGKLAGLLRREGRTYYLEGSTTPLAGKHDFVIKNGEILVGEGHGFLAGGERVTWAGELNFANDGSGMLESFSNVSGHIRPYGGFVGNIDSPLLFGVPFVPPSYFPFGLTGGPQLPVFQPRF